MRFEFKAHDEGHDGPKQMLQNNCNAPELLVLKEGAQVMLLKNLSTERGLVNGSRGVVVGFQEAEEDYDADPSQKTFVKIHATKRWPRVEFRSCTEA